MPTLLVSLGTSPAIVPEAFLLPETCFASVHVLTTDSEEINTQFILDWFRDQAPKVTVTITRVAGFKDFKSETDHFRFEEILYRWMLGKAPAGNAHVCLSGGFKTMSAAVQKAAAVLGATEVFHVLADSIYQTADGKPRPAQTTAEIAESITGRNIHWIRLGPESGWPQFCNEAAANYPLETEREQGPVRWVTVPDQRFRERLHEVVERSHRIAGVWEHLDRLPFPTLATWSAADLAWLEQPVDPVADRSWIAALPKVELHCHLGGFATCGKTLHEVRKAADTPESLPALTEPDEPTRWPEPHAPIQLKEYMALGNANGSALLGDPGCLRRQCELLYRHMREQNIVYAEIRCSPANYGSATRSPWTVLNDIKTTFDRCMNEDSGCHVNLIIIATRKESGDYRATISRHLALAVSAAEHWNGDQECRVVGVDLAGYEDMSTRAHYFRDEFTAIHRCGLALTVHAGENDDAEGIWRAVFDLNARRLGHALHLIDSPELMRSVADRRVCVEMCPYANFQIKGFHPMKSDAAGTLRPQYPLKHYLDAGLRVTVNTDNIGISGASLTENFLFASRLCPELSRIDVLRLLSHAADASFLTPCKLLALRQQLAAWIPLPKIPPRP
jgi:adenosine deaminase